MTNSILTAVVSPVQIGHLTIDGLLAENKEFYVGLPQMVESGLILALPDNAAKSLKRSLPEGSMPVRLKTKFNSNPVLALTILDFEKLLAKLDRAGNLSAQKLRDDLVGLSLRQLFADSFNIKFEKEDRQLWLQERQSTKASFRPLTDKLQEFGFQDGWEYGRFVAAFQAKIGIECGTRDSLSYADLSMLQSAQTKVTAYMECGFNPWDALDRLNVN
jgi:hypothetical protein